MTLRADTLVARTEQELRGLVTNYENAIRENRLTESVAKRRADGYELDLAEIRKALARKVNPNGPLSNEQRRALFAAYADVFGEDNREQRLAFTRMILGKRATAPVSWSNFKHGRLTYAEASKVLDALNLLNV